MHYKIKYQNLCHILSLKFNNRLKNYKKNIKNKWMIINKDLYNFINKKLFIEQRH